MELPESGQVFQGRYKLAGLLGRGGFAAVYRAIDIEIGRDVAIKVLLPGEDGYAAGLVARFLREARVVAQLRDPHTITMFDFGRTDDGMLYMVFEYVAGADLAQLIGEEGGLPPDTVVHVLDQILRALREAHAAGVLHRDIKPANILVYTYMDDDRQVKLLDFGIAKPGVGKNADPVATITQAGGIVGTPRYMAPEQLYGGDLTPATDIYSLGLVAYEMLVGRPAIDGGSTRENLKLQLSEAPLRLPTALQVPPALRAIVERMIARDPALRPQSAYEVLTALADLHGRAITAEPGRAQTTKLPGLGQPRPRPASGPLVATPKERRPLPLPAIAALGAFAGAAIVVPLVVYLSRDSPIERTAGAPADPPGLAQRQNPLAPTMPTPPSVPVAAVAVPDAGSVGDPCAGAKRPRVGRMPREGTVGLQERTWEVYTPESYRGTQRVPLLMLFHDRTRSALRELQETGFVQIADEQGFVIVALNGTSYTNPWSEGDNVPFVERVIEETSQTHCIDPEQIFAVGHNVAGEFVGELGCRGPVAAIATTAHRAPAPCKLDRPVPFLHITGRENRYHPTKGGLGCDGQQNISLEEMERSWRDANGCSGEREVYLRHASGECATWTCKAPAAFCLVDGGRDWPNSSARDLELPACKVPPGNFPFAQTIWKFFASQSPSP